MNPDGGVTAIPHDEEQSKDALPPGIGAIFDQLDKPEQMDSAQFARFTSNATCFRFRRSRSTHYSKTLDSGTKLAASASQMDWFFQLPFHRVNVRHSGAKATPAIRPDAVPEMVEQK